MTTTTEFQLVDINKLVPYATATAFTFEEKRKKGQKEYQEKAWVRERL